MATEMTKENRLLSYGTVSFQTSIDAHIKHAHKCLFLLLWEADLEDPNTCSSLSEQDPAVGRRSYTNVAKAGVLSDRRSRKRT